MKRQVNINNLLARKTHILDSIDGHREKLSQLWIKGITSGKEVEHHKKLLDKAENNLDKINDLLFSL